MQKEKIYSFIILILSNLFQQYFKKLIKKILMIKNCNIKKSLRLFYFRFLSLFKISRLLFYNLNKITISKLFEPSTVLTDLIS